MTMTPEDFVRAAYRITLPHGFLGDEDYADKLDFSQGWPKTCLEAVCLALSGVGEEFIQERIRDFQNDRAKDRAARVAALVAGHRLPSKQRPRQERDSRAAERAANTAALLARLTGGGEAVR